MPSSAGRDPGRDTRPRTARGTDLRFVYRHLTPLLTTSVSRDLGRREITLLPPRQEVSREPRHPSWHGLGHPTGESSLRPEELRRRGRRTPRNALVLPCSAAWPGRELFRASWCGPPPPRP